MTPQERELIQSVANRLRGVNLPGKDADAERLIQTDIGGQPDALYLLTQAVIVQEQGLKHAEARIRQLEADLQTARQQAAQGAAPKHSSFLGGLFGGSSAPAPTPPPPPAPTAPPPVQPTGTMGGGGSFLQTAAATAAGVVGGQLIFDGLRHMFGGGYGYGMPVGGGFLGGGSPIIEENVTNVVEENVYDDAPDTRNDSQDDQDDQDDSGDDHDDGGEQDDYDDSGDDQGFDDMGDGGDTF
jgi:hypothetical protein